jgi:signal transduction histidine kinase
MTLQSARRLAWGIGTFCLVLVVAGLVLLLLDWPAIDSPFTAQTPWFLDAVITGVLGVLIATRRPRNPIGWLLLAISFGNAIYLVGGFVAMLGLLHGASPSSWVGWPAWVFNWTAGFGAFLLMVLVFFFPDGRLPGPRWRWVAYFAVVANLVSTLASMLDTSPVTLSPRLPNVPNPIGVGAISTIVNSAPGIIVLIPLFVVVIASVFVRFRRSTGVERQQLKWFAYIVAGVLGVTIAGFALSPLNSLIGGAVASVGFDLGIGVALPLTIGLAVMKYGLYDIDVFISRTIVYGTLAAFITSVYVGIAVGIGTLVGSGGRPNLGLSIVATAIVSIGFQPVRERVQRVANRLVYGQRATPYEVLSEFSGRVAETYSADDVLPRMARVLRDGTGAESATVWLRSGDQLRAAATDPASSDGHATLKLNGNALPAVTSSDRAVAVAHQGELLGALSVVKRRGESLTPLEMKLIDDLAHQAGLVLKNVGLTDELMQRLEELRMSRQRLVQAQDEERRRLERNLHDGAQQHLVALKVKLGLAQSLAQRDPEKARDMVRQLKADADEALETLRDLARGIYPPLLADKGLPAALQAQARKATLPVTVDADGVGRYPQDVEAAVYFSVLEALQNVQKYASASRASVRLRDVDGTVRFEIEDDGRGFDMATTKRGAGLTNIADRLDALGGSFHMKSQPGEGTALSGVLPVGPAVMVAV